MRPAILALIPICLATPALAASPPGPDLVIEALDQACAGFLSGDGGYDLGGRAEALAMMDFGPFYGARAPGADVLLSGQAPEGGQPGLCRVALDSDPSIAAPLPARIKVWAKNHGFKPVGKPTPGADDKGRALVATRWSGAAGQLEMRELATAPSNGRINVVIDWTGNAR
ncbi:MAG: hypothetical protein KF842_04945 [Caulobacter sp.]|nr:hypothetical protein [Caulobacter sp.]